MAQVCVFLTTRTQGICDTQGGYLVFIHNYVYKLYILYILLYILSTLLY